MTEETLQFIEQSDEPAVDEMADEINRLRAEAVKIAAWIYLNYGIKALRDCVTEVESDRIK